MRRLERAARRLLYIADATGTRIFGAPWNPVHQSGTVAALMLIVLTVTGLYLVFVYRISAPSESVARIAADPFIGSWMRSLHRYSSDLFIVAAALHFLRMFAQGRNWGPRVLAWISGLVLLGIGFVCAWTGFVIAWDTFGERLAKDGARLLDVLPVFSEPLSRIFAGDRPVPPAFFFVNLFAHISIPLAMGVVLWLHVSKLARPVILPPKRVAWGIVVSFTALSVIMPAELGPAADPYTVPGATPLNVFAAWWLPLTERMTSGGAWLFWLGSFTLVASVPLFARRKRESLAPSVVDPRLCTGCNQCPQDCPWEAITMVERADGRKTLLAQVDHSKCVSCGICAGSCKPMGIGPPERTGRDQLFKVRQETREMTEPFPVVAICCSKAPSSHVKAMEDRGALIQKVSCAGNLHSSVVELLVREGAPGVLVCTCPRRDCANREGPKWLNERLFNGREAELKERVDRRRVGVAVLAPGYLPGTVEAFESFARNVAALDLPSHDQQIDIDLLCQPAAVEENA